MNYIKHLNGFFERLSEDKRMSAYHLGLYMALFYQWNLNRFRNPFPILREELMEQSRIGSKTTYARCMKELHGWGYITYSPSGNWHTGRQVSCTRFDTEDSPGFGTGTEPRTGTLFINSTNNNKRDKQGRHKNFQDGGRKKINGHDRLNNCNDKDYSEPL